MNGPSTGVLITGEFRNAGCRQTRCALPARPLVVRSRRGSDRGIRPGCMRQFIEQLILGSFQTGLNVYVIPKNLGNNDFTVADSVKTGGALAALQTLGEKGTETSGSAATAASQLPAIQSSLS